VGVLSMHYGHTQVIFSQSLEVLDLLKQHILNDPGLRGPNKHTTRLPVHALAAGGSGAAAAGGSGALAGGSSSHAMVTQPPQLSGSSPPHVWRIDGAVKSENRSKAIEEFQAHTGFGVRERSCTVCCLLHLASYLAAMAHCLCSVLHV
jgi:hypothetical protein